MAHAVRNGPTAAGRATSGPSVRFNWKNVVQSPVKLPRGQGATDIQRYMQEAMMDRLVSGFGRLPLGAQLRRLDDTRLQLDFPKLQLFDVWVEPRVGTTVR